MILGYVRMLKIGLNFERKNYQAGCLASRNKPKILGFTKAMHANWLILDSISVSVMTCFSHEVVSIGCS